MNVSTHPVNGRARKVRKVIYGLMLGTLCISMIRFREHPPKDTSLKLVMKWHKAYERQTWSDVRTGMLWSFSYLGATLPKQSFDRALQFRDSSLFEIDLAKLGFSADARRALGVVCQTIRESDDYQANGHIDLSRFFMLTLHSSYNYYRITGVEQNYRSFRKRYCLDAPNVFGVTNSSVSKGHRCIRFSSDTTLFNVGFVAEEGRGSLADSSFEPSVFETFDIMPNGQLRYAIYDRSGELVAASDPELSGSGKPPKCMWCHELYIQPLFSRNEPVTHMMSNEAFMSCVARFQAQLDAYRRTLDTDIDFSKKQDHTQSELLYISFMEAPAYRLRSELAGDTAALGRLRQLPTHVYEEFPFLGELYHRKEVDALFARLKIRVPESVRERGSYEPDYFR